VKSRASTDTVIFATWMMHVEPLHSEQRVPAMMRDDCFADCSAANDDAPPHLVRPIKMRLFKSILTGLGVGAGSTELPPPSHTRCLRQMVPGTAW